MRRTVLVVTAICATFLGASLCRAQTTLNAYNAVFRSSGAQSGSNWELTDNGYVGTFIHLDNPGTVQINVVASGASAGGVWPTMDLHVGDQDVQWSVSSATPGTYTATVQLPAGTHALRTALINATDGGAAGTRDLFLQSLTLSGPGTNVAVQNYADATHVNAAADTYIANYRQGPAAVTLLAANGAPMSGAQVHVKLRSHAFNFGTAVPGTSLTDPMDYLAANPALGSTAYTYQQALKQNFNMVVPGNGGKWAYNEATRNVVTMQYVDQFLNFAQQNGLRARMHNMLWATNNGQQPGWASTLENAALSGDSAAAASLSLAITSRVNYYVGQRAVQYTAVDGINESYHLPTFQNIYGMAGLANIYNQIIDAAQTAGSSAAAYFNEYSVYGSNYGDWYRQHIQSVIDAGITADNRARLGIGIQNYTRSDWNSVVDMYKTVQNLATMGLPITLTEFGDSTTDPNPSQVPNVLRDNMRVIFGSDQTTGFLNWGFWQPEMWSANTGAAFYDANWNLTATGKAYQQMLGIHNWGLTGLPTWTTDVTLTADANGRVSLTGFYGDYDVTIGAATASMGLLKGVTNYSVSLNVLAGDANCDGTVDINDLSKVLTSYNRSGMTWADGDFNGDGDVDINDLSKVLTNYNTSTGASAGMQAVPEPGSIMLLLAGVAFLLVRTARQA
jgi:endo-1,4-beta-xylanase